MAEDDLPAGHTLGLGGADIVLAQHVQHGGAGQSEKNAIVYRPADDEGNVVIQIQGKKMTVRHHRLKLLVPAAELYPPDYDFSIVFDTVANRKAAHTMARKFDPDAVIILKEETER